MGVNVGLGAETLAHRGRNKMTADPSLGSHHIYGTSVHIQIGSS